MRFMAFPPSEVVIAVRRPLESYYIRMSGKRQVLFICEHGSAKSVIAAAHLDRLARERGDSVHARSRGTNPDSAYPPHVVAGLAAEGLVPLDDAPCQLRPSDFDGVTDVIRF